MKKMVKRPISILNLANEISSELSRYFQTNNIQITHVQDSSPGEDWTHILTSNISDFTSISKTYRVLENDVKIVSLSEVENLQQFVACNGKLIINEVWMKNSLGVFILDKFFQEYGGVAFGDNYPVFKEKGSFIIANPFNTGEYLDRMIYEAFNDGVSALSIKTFFDHLIMYLTDLKTKGKLGLPIEVSYGYFEDIFGVQLNFFTKNLKLEDVTSSLSSTINKKAEKYLLNVAVQSTDFFDFTLLKEVNKTVITGLWTKDERIKIENRGLSFNELSASAPLTQYPSEGITSFQTNNPTLIDFSDKVVLTGSSDVNDDEEIIRGGNERKNDFLQVINFQFANDEKSQIVKDQKDENEQNNLVKGELQEEQIQIVKIHGENEEKDDFKFILSGGESKSDKNFNQKIIKMSNSLPVSLKNNFYDFIKELNKPFNEVNEFDLENFKNKEIARFASALNITVPLEVGERFNSLTNENKVLKSKMKTLIAEVKIIKESTDQRAHIQSIVDKSASVAACEIETIINPDDELKSQLVEKLKEHKTIAEQDRKKISALLDRGSIYFQLAREEERKSKKVQIELMQKEAFYGQEIEKLQRALRAKDVIIYKTKETFTKLIEMKEQELNNLIKKNTQERKFISDYQSQNQGFQIRELERQISNQEKMLEIYKNKSIHNSITKPEDDALKEDNRRLQNLYNQMKNLIETNKKDILKYQERLAEDGSIISTLKSDKLKLEGLLKRAHFEAKKEELNPIIQKQEIEIRRLHNQNEAIEVQLKETQSKFKEIEAKLQEALKHQKKEVFVEDTIKGKTGYLENNVRKLTQDLVESRNQLAEMKKETNKLRQEKNDLQNQLDKLIKETDKNKPAVPKKLGSSSKGGKAA